MSFHVLFVIGMGGLFLLWAVLLIACFFPEPDEVAPELDAGYTDEALVVIQSPWQFSIDGETGDWLFVEEWEDGSEHWVRIHFTTASAQGTVTEWVGDALVAKTDAFLREHRG